MHLDFHQNQSIYQPLPGQVPQFFRIVHLHWPQNQVVAIFMGGVSGAGNKLKFSEPKAAF